MTTGTYHSALRERYDLFIDGRATPPALGGYFSTFDPATGAPLSEVARGSREDIDAAAQSAKRALADSAWIDCKPHERGRMLARLAASLIARVDELAIVETLDTGKPLSQARGDVLGAARYFEYFGGLADKIEGSQIPLGSSHVAFTALEPYGVLGIIVPWNAPINQAARSLAPALAAGNAVILKPAEETPLTGVRLAELALDAGFPAGVVNVVTGYGDEAGQALTEHPLVRKIFFTGSVETGQRIVKTTADQVVPVSLELGGKSANVIFPDADLTVVADSILRTVTKNAGQICSAATRVLASVGIIDELIDRTSRALSSITVGPGIDDPMLGPLVSEKQMERVLRYIDDGRREGATAVVGGARYSDERLRTGYFVQPTIFRNVDTKMRIAQEEIFGPVVCVIPFVTEDEAVATANETAYGLVAGVYTRDIGRALRMARSLEAGQVFINDYQAGGVETPFGGYKQSGWGREKGLEAIKHYTQIKTVVIRIQD